MRILYYDCFSGISGDMHLGAMLDLGVDERYLRDSLALLGLEHEYHIRVGPGQRKGITGTRVEVELSEKSHTHHRHLGDIRDIIKSSSLPAHISAKSMEAFEILAEAEAVVHGTSIEEVHFHEVGATDAIVDIVGAALCIDSLHVDAVYASPVELGGGFVTCAHGTMPVPAPATAEILKGVPATFGAVPVETTTPTGAAILASHVREYMSRPSFAISKVGYGIGGRDNDIPNVLRVYSGTTTDSAHVRWDKGTAILLETNIDDMSPEAYGHVSDLLFSRGAKDVYTAPIVMKKGRPATLLSILCDPDDEDALVETLFTETTTLGVRSIPVGKHMMHRKMLAVHTPYGKVRVKAAYLGGQLVKRKPEYEDCRRIAVETGVPLAEIYAQALNALGEGNVP